MSMPLSAGLVSETNYAQHITQLLQAAQYQVSNINPSNWTEQRRVMTSDVSPFPGKFSFERTPYLKEIVDTLAPDHPARRVAVMKGAQIGFSTAVIESGIGWIISEKPGNILFLTGSSDLTMDAMTGKIDQMIDSCGIRPLIKPNVLRKKNQRTGDTNLRKEFPGGRLIAGSASNHKFLRQLSVQYGFIDDFDSVIQKSKESGSTEKLFEQRFAAYGDRMKVYYISTPELEETSNILNVYLKGDQRKWHIPCPCCGEFIVLEWETNLGDSEHEKAGIFYRLTETGKLIEDSVGYVCQSCGNFFDDSLKYELNLAGQWMPTAEASRSGYYSYHISALSAPPGMYDWKHYVHQYLDAMPPGAEPKPREVQTFHNLCLGIPYKAEGEAIRATTLQQNIRTYPIKVVPESTSIKDGNGRIIMLTAACDLNGVLDDARLDYEIVAHAENGSTYSIDHGSIGTFVPRENSKKYKHDRERFTYQHGHPNSVWPLFKEVLATKYPVETGTHQTKNLKVLITGIDVGYMDKYAWPFIDGANIRETGMLVGLKGEGKEEARALRLDRDLPLFKPARERGNMYIVESNVVKDELHDLTQLKWDPGMDEGQPAGFMNFPQPSEGKYLYVNYFSHYEAEQRVVDDNGKYLWKKKDSAVQNHLFDCRLYNLVARNVWASLFCKQYKILKGTYADFVKLLNTK